MNETWKHEGLNLTLLEVSFEIAGGEHTDEPAAKLLFSVENNTGQTLNFSFDTKNIFVTDNIGNRYVPDDQALCTKGYILKPGDSFSTLNFECFNWFPGLYFGNILDPNVTHLNVTVKEFGRIPEAVWQVPVLH